MSDNNPNVSTDNKEKETETVKKNIFKPNSKYFTITIYALFFVFGAILINILVGSFGTTLSLIGTLLSLLSPFITGVFISFILFPFVKFLYKRVFTDILHIKSQKLAKWLSIASAYVVAIAAISVLVVFIFPQVYESVMEITAQLPGWYKSCIEFITNFELQHPELNSVINFENINNKIETALPSLIDYLTSILTNLIPVIFSTSMAIVKGVFNFIIAIIVSVYMISDHKYILYHGRRLIYAFLPIKVADTARKILKESSRIFSSFICGKAIDSLIIGIICFFAMLIFKMPYAVLISIIVGITNMIPYFGPYFGGILGGIIIFIVSPVKTIMFAILILIIQQFDGLFLGPKILGDSTGLRPLWVIFSITIGGALFGVLGMFLGVPTVAVLSYILNLSIGYFLKKKNVEITPDKEPDKME